MDAREGLIRMERISTLARNFELSTGYAVLRRVKRSVKACYGENKPENSIKIKYLWRAWFLISRE